MIQRVLQEKPKNKILLCKARLRWRKVTRKDCPADIGENYGGREWKGIAENKKVWTRFWRMARWFKGITKKRKHVLTVYNSIGNTG